MPPQRDRSRKAFSYLEAAMYFVESGIAMEKDPQIYRSSYTMFADTVDLLRCELLNSVSFTLHSLRVAVRVELTA